MRITRPFIVLVISLQFYSILSGQNFYLGNDLSYANQMEDCGAIFKEDHTPKDVYQIFADHGTNLVRVRLWYDPSWQNDLVQPEGVKEQYSDFDDVKETISRAKEAGMQVMLGFQLSDFWADQGRQIIPAKWLSVAEDTAALADSVYNYISRTLTVLNDENLLPEIVKIGNECNNGLLKHKVLNSDYTGGGTVSSSWTRHAKLWNAGIKAVRDFDAQEGSNTKICLHFAGLNWLKGFYQRLIDYGVVDFDIMGFSYYYAWHDASIEELGDAIRDLKSTFPAYDAMVVETGYPWSTENFDDLGNIITATDPDYLPVSPQKQLEYMADYTREVMRAGGSGVIFWEPAWVSTPCRTLWGQGSSHDHLAFFDPVDYNFIEDGGGCWTEPQHYEDLSTQKVTFKVSINKETAPDTMYITGTMTGDPWTIQPMLREATNLYNYVRYLQPGDTGAFYFLTDSTWEARETVPAECADSWDTDRKYWVPEKDTVITYHFGTCDPAGSASLVNVTFKVDMTGQDVSSGVWITGSMTGGASWEILPMTEEDDNIYSRSFEMYPGDSGAFYFMNDDVWGSREMVPAECATWWNSDRGYKIADNDTVFAFTWGTCEPPGNATYAESLSGEKNQIVVYPNPVDRQQLNILFPSTWSGITKIILQDLGGRIHYSLSTTNLSNIRLPCELTKGSYILIIEHNKQIYYEKIILLN